MYKVFNGMDLIWKENITPLEVSVDGLNECSVFFTESNKVEERLIKLNVIECVDKSITLLGKNITEKSLYYLCEWDTMCSTLTIVVTDETKSMDSKNIVKCCFSNLNKTFHKFSDKSELEREYIANNYSSMVYDCIRDYLTTCSGFMTYSLVAIFHSSDRRSTELI